jgi:hypothetical protein
MQSWHCGLSSVKRTGVSELQSQTPERKAYMSTFLITLLQTAVKFVLFVAIALAGIICGKKFKDKKNSQ